MMKRILLILLFLLLLTTHAFSGVNNVLLCNVDSDTSFRPPGYCNNSVLTEAANLTLSTNENNIAGCSMDAENEFLYCTISSTGSAPDIVKIRLSDFTRISSSSISDTDVQTVAVDSANSFLYVSGGNTIITKVRISDFTEVATLNVSNLGLHITLTIDKNAGYLYISNAVDTGQIYKISLSTFTVSNTIANINTDTTAGDAAIDLDNGFVYFIGRHSSAPSYPKMLKVSLSTFSISQTLNFTSYPGVYARCIVLDTIRNIGYMTLETSPATIKKIDLSTMTEIDSLTLSAGETPINSGAIDTLNNFAYFGTDTNPGKIVRVNLENFIRDSALTLTQVKNMKRKTGTIDLINQYTYWGSFGLIPGSVVKIGICGD